MQALDSPLNILILIKLQVEQDFELLYPQKSNFVIKWPEMKTKVVEVAKGITGNDTVTSLLKMIQAQTAEETDEFEGDPDEEGSPADNNGRDKQYF